MEDFKIKLANEIADFLNTQKKEFGEFVDFAGFGGSGLTFTDFYKHLEKKIKLEKENDRQR